MKVKFKVISVLLVCFMMILFTTGASSLDAGEQHAKTVDEAVIIPYTLSNTMDDDGNNDESGSYDLSITLFTPNGNPYHPLIGAAVPNALDASVECSHDWSPWYPAVNTCHKFCKICGAADNPGHHYDRFVSVNSSQHEISCIRCGYVYGNYAHIFTTTPMGNGVLKLTCTKCNHTEYVYAKK